jgi:hypothetical protein
VRSSFYILVVKDLGLGKCEYMYSELGLFFLAFLEVEWPPQELRTTFVDFDHNNEFFLRRGRVSTPLIKFFTVFPYAWKFI